MRGAADGSGFFRGDAPKTEIVQLEWKKRGIAGADEGFADDLLYGARERGDSDGIPDLEQNGFRPVGEPIEFGIGVFDGDERVVTLDDCAFFHGADAQREAATMFRVKSFKTFVIKSFAVATEMGVGKAAGFLDVFESENLAGEVGFDDVLKHSQHGF